MAAFLLKAGPDPIYRDEFEGFEMFQPSVSTAVDLLQMRPTRRTRFLIEPLDDRATGRGNLTGGSRLRAAAVASTFSVAPIRILVRVNWHNGEGKTS
jgi:hypothetical protein